MKIATITAGAAGMFCGSCMRDNTLVAALCQLGHEALLIPTYTPIRTDEENVSQHRVFFGGINVYLQQKLSLFRHTPWFLDRLLDWPTLLRWVSRFALGTRAEDLGELTVSMLEGEHGLQQKEVTKLVLWLAEQVRPDVVNLSNALLSGMVHELKRHLKVPVIVSLQGDDVFTESLPEPYRDHVLTLIREHCQEIDGFLATSAAYADFMADYFAIARDKIDVVRPGLNLRGHGGPRPERAPDRPFTIGYFARICPEKGFHVLIEAFRLLRQTTTARVKLKVSGWLGSAQRAYYNAQVKLLESSGLVQDFEHVECPDHTSKVRFLQDLDVLSVPTVYHEPKGLYVLEALANAVPVVQPRHGSFPELVALTGGGLLVEPENPADLADGLRTLLEDPSRAEAMGRRGQLLTQEYFNAGRMAQETVATYRRYLS